VAQRRHKWEWAPPVRRVDEWDAYLPAHGEPLAPIYDEISSDPEVRKKGRLLGESWPGERALRPPGRRPY